MSNWNTTFDYSEALEICQGYVQHFNDSANTFNQEIASIQEMNPQYLEILAFKITELEQKKANALAQRDTFSSKYNQFSLISSISNDDKNKLFDIYTLSGEEKTTFAMRQGYYSSEIIDNCFPIVQDNTIDSQMKQELIREVLLQKFSQNIHPNFFPSNDPIGNIVATPI